MGFITMIASGKDGVGKSAVAALLGQAMAKKGKKTLVIELDNSPGCMDVYTSTSDSVYDLGDIFTESCKPEEAIVHSPLSENLDVIYSSHERSSFTLTALCDTILDFSQNYDHILIDTDCSDEVISTISSVSMHNIVIGTPNPMSLRDSKEVCDKLHATNAADLRFLLNRVHPGYITSKTVKNMDECIDTVGVKLIGLVPESDDIRKLLYGGTLKKNSVIWKVFNNIASRIEGEDTPLAITKL